MTYENLLWQLASENEKIIVLTAENRAAIRNLPEKLGNRFIDTGITEQTLAGFSAGLALRGRLPITHALAAFLTMRAFEFIRTDIGLPSLNVKLVGSFNGLQSEANGPTHQALEDISLMRGIPNFKVFSPADENDMLIMLPKIIEDSAPAYIRYNGFKASFNHNPFFEIGKAEIIKIGNDVNILTHGILFNECLSAMSILNKFEISTGLINMRSLKPADEETLLGLADKQSLLVTVEDHFLNGGLFTIISELFTLNKISAHIMPIAFRERWFRTGLLEDVLNYEKLKGAQLADRIAQKLKSIN